MLPVQITVRDFPASPALELDIRKRAQKLSRFYSRINSCRVVLEFSQKHKHQGKIYNVRIDVTVPGKELVATHKYHQDVYVAIRDAFYAILRQLEEHGRKRNGQVKVHNELKHGFITRMFTKEGYGFIEGTDGNEYYFSLTNVAYPTFAQLSVGDAVEYTAAHFSEGWQAQHVVKEKQHH